MKSGIYRILNTVTGQAYVGSSCNVTERWTRHRRQLKLGNHHSRYLQRAWNKYGEAAFTWELLFKCPVDGLIKSEQDVMDVLLAANPEHGYNLSPIAGRPGPIVVSEETRAKISAAGRGRKASAETIAKVAAAHRGMKRSKETCDRIGAKSKGRVHSKESRAKMSAKLREQYLSGERKTSEKSKLTTAAANSSRVHTEESRRKMADAQRGRTHSEETKKKIGDTQRGRPVSAKSEAAFRKYNAGIAANKMRLTPELMVLRASGLSLAAIAKMLNDRGEPTLRGDGKWDKFKVFVCCRGAGKAELPNLNPDCGCDYLSVRALARFNGENHAHQREHQRPAPAKQSRCRAGHRRDLEPTNRVGKIPTRDR